MTGISESSTIEKPATTKRGPKRVARNPGRPKGQKSFTTIPRRKAKPGQGTERLLSAVNSRVSRQSDRIAQALIDKAATGSVPSARLLVEMAHASTPPPEDEKKKKEPGDSFSFAEFLACEPEDYEPPRGSIWVHDHWENPDVAPEDLVRVNTFEEAFQRIHPMSDPRPVLAVALAPDDSIGPIPLDPSRFHPPNGRSGKTDR